MDDIKYMDPKEFRKLGFLQEVNRCFLHPLGLALSIAIDDETGKETMGPIWDYRDDPEGITFCEEAMASPAAKEKRDHVRDERGKHLKVRRELFGQFIQPISE
jgi:hypothetical protein